RKSCVCTRELRVQLYRLPIKRSRLLVVLAPPDQKQHLRAQETIVSFQAACVSLGDPLSLGIADLRRQQPDQLGGDFVLDGEEVTDWPLESLGPELLTGLGVDEMDIDPQHPRFALDAARN